MESREPWFSWSLPNSPACLPLIDTTMEWRRELSDLSETNTGLEETKKKRLSFWKWIKLSGASWPQWERLVWAGSCNKLFWELILSGKGKEDHKIEKRVLEAGEKLGPNLVIGERRSRVTHLSPGWVCKPSFVIFLRSVNSWKPTSKIAIHL